VAVDSTIVVMSDSADHCEEDLSETEAADREHQALVDQAVAGSVLIHKGSKFYWRTGIHLDLFIHSTESLDCVTVLSAPQKAAECLPPLYLCRSRIVSRLAVELAAALAHDEENDHKKASVEKTNARRLANESRLIPAYILG
jgi:hypothetical protein